MGSLVNPKPWVPYLNSKDCSQGFCTLYCPQWCYIIFPPPPPIEFPTENTGPNFSPLIIVIIGILASAFLLVSYYAIVSKYFRHNSSSGRRQNHDSIEDLENNEDPSGPEPWHGVNNGLDEALIKSITVCKYKKGYGLIEGTDCSVCLSEFEDDENLRLLPKCSHAFHVVCIDTWLKSHSNCPLCRANIVSICPPLPPLPLNVEIVSQIGQEQDFTEDIETGTLREEEPLQNAEEEDKDILTEIRDEKFRQARRSVSMDFDYGQRLSIVDVLLLKQDVDFKGKGNGLQNDDIGSSKNFSCGKSRLSMERSYSCGTFLLAKQNRETK